MTKKQLLALSYSTLTTVLATGAMLWFEGTHPQMAMMLPGYRELGAFAWGNVWWPMVAFTFVLMAVLAMPWWALAFAGPEGAPAGRRFSLFPFLQRRGLDHLLTMLNVFSTLGVTVSLLLLTETGLPQYDPTQAERFRLYLLALMMFWGAVYFLISFLLWRRFKI